MNAIEFPPIETKYIAEFLCYVSDDSKKPNSVLKVVKSALKSLYKGMGLEDVFDENVNDLCTALVKSGTTEPMKRSDAMPVDNFAKLFFVSWGSNELLTLKQLRLKSITLLALSLMLRPSDIAPRSCVYDQCQVQLDRKYFVLIMSIF